MTVDPALLRLYLVTDRDLAGGRPLGDIVLAAVRGGVTMVQIREKQTATRSFIEQGRSLKQLLSSCGVPLIVNDRVDVALAIGADGVHVGDDDMPCTMARQLLGPGAIIGRSLLAAPDAEAAAADYFAASPVFATGTKPDAGPGLGLAGVAALRRAVDRPLIGIGGIDRHNARAVIEAGADGVAVVSAIIAAEDPQAAARALREAMAGALAAASTGECR
jgi:thiamine-phosphate pyrophosphorylase